MRSILRLSFPSIDNSAKVCFRGRKSIATRSLSCWSFPLIATAFFGFFPASAIAQIVPDHSLGSERSIPVPTPAGDLVTGGARRGGNLFHSFREFNVGESGRVFFFDPGVANIFSRVTGGNPSRILGTLGVTGEANLFLINPNGIIFGPNSNLALQGSFIATTASGVRFADGTMFATTVDSPLLTVSVPVGLQFGPNPGAIVNRSLFRYPGLPLDVFAKPTGLTLGGRPGQTLALVGGEIVLESGSVTVFGGRVELGAVGANSYVSLNPTAEGLVLGYEGTNTFGDIRLSGGASVDTSDGLNAGEISIGKGSGAIALTGDRVSLTGGSRLISLNAGVVRGGNIVVNAHRSLEIQGTGNYVEDLQQYAREAIKNYKFENGIFTIGYGPASAGDIIINTERLSLRDGAFVIASTGETEKVRGGDVSVNASRSIEARASAIFSATTPNSTGDAGNIEINTAALTLEDTAGISASTLGSGKGGDLTVNVTDSIVLREARPFPLRNNVFSTTGLTTNSLNAGSSNVGSSGNLNVTTDRLSVQDGAVVSVSTFTAGNGGTLTVTANEIFLTGRSLDGRIISQLAAFTEGGSSGAGGNVRVTARSLQIEGGASVGASSLGTGTAGNVRIEADRIVLRDGGTIEARSLFDRGGDISIETNSLTLTNGSGINATANGSQKAGNIEIRVRDSLQMTDSEIVTSALFSSGGNLTVEAGAIRLQGNSDLRTNVLSGTGGGGDITLKADSILAFGDSDILAFSRDGRGGNILLDTPLFLADGYRPIEGNSDDLEGNGRSDVNASGAIAGVVTLPDLDFIQNGLVPFSVSLISTENLIGESCVVPDRRRSGRFVIRGRDSFPTRPGGENPRSFPTQEVEGVPGRSIREPSGMYVLSSGRRVLSRSCE